MEEESFLPTTGDVEVYPYLYLCLMCHAYKTYIFFMTESYHLGEGNNASTQDVENGTEEIKSITEGKSSIDTRSSECYKYNVIASIANATFALLASIAYSLDSPDSFAACISFILCISFVQALATMIHYKSPIKSDCPLKLEIKSELEKLQQADSEIP